jgi:acyl carrier protein
MTDEIVSVLGQQIAADILKEPGRVIKPDERLISNGLIDSFHLVDLALFVEDRFGVRIDDADLNAAAFDTLDELAGLIRQRQA